MAEHRRGPGENSRQIRLHQHRDERGRESLGSVENNDREPEPSGEEGLADVRIIEAMHRSARTGRWVDLGVGKRKSRATMRQEKRRPAVPREPPLVNAEGASQ